MSRKLFPDLYENISRIQSRLERLESSLRELTNDVRRARISSVPDKEYAECVIDCIDAAGTLTAKTVVAVSSMDDNGLLRVVAASQSVSNGEVLGVATRNSFNNMTSVKIYGLGIALWDSTGDNSKLWADIALGDNLYASDVISGQVIVHTSKLGNAGRVVAKYELDGVKHIVFDIKKGGSGGGGSDPDDITIELDGDSKLADINRDDALVGQCKMCTAVNTFGYSYLKAL